MRKRPSVTNLENQSLWNQAKKNTNVFIQVRNLTHVRGVVNWREEIFVICNEGRLFVTQPY